MKTINFYSYKGGVGRTLLMAQVARFLAALGKKVVIVDFDFDAPGVPAIFGIPTMVSESKDDRERNIDFYGLFELVEKCSEGNYGHRRVKPEELDDVLLDVPESHAYVKKPISSEKNGDKTEGSIRILATGRINKYYWQKIADVKWLQLIAAKESDNRSLVRFIKDCLMPTLEEEKIDYLLIDSRASITNYAQICRHIADRQVFIFSPSKESEYALKGGLLENLSGLDSDRKDDIHVYVVSRTPPELEESDKRRAFDTISKFIVGQEMEKKRMDANNSGSIQNDDDKSDDKEESIKEIQKKVKTPSQLASKKNETQKKYHTYILKFDSDMETHLNPQARMLTRDLMTKGKAVVAKMHEDVLQILVSTCPEICVEFMEKQPDNFSDVIAFEKEGSKSNDSDYFDEQLRKKKGHALWKTIFGYDFTITRRNRIFSFRDDIGEMRNPEDGSRNIAFKVATYLKFLNMFYDTIVNVYADMFNKEFFLDAVTKEFRLICGGIENMPKDNLEKYAEDFRRAVTETSIDFKEKDKEKPHETEGTKTMNTALYRAGEESGKAFGESLASQWESNSPLKQKIEQWCSFDTQAGFGIMKYDESSEGKILSIKNPFIMGHETLGRDYTAFLTGYMIGVLRQLTEGKLKIVSMKKIKHEDEYVKIYEKGEHINYPFSTDSQADNGIKYLLEYE